MDVGGVGVYDFCRGRGRSAVHPSEARLLDESWGDGSGRLPVIGQHAAGLPTTRQVTVRSSERRQGRGCRRVRALRRRPADCTGLRYPGGRGRDGQRRLCRDGNQRRLRDEPLTVRCGRRCGDRRAADHGRKRGRAHHVTGGRGQPSANHFAVDGSEKVRDHGGGHLRVRPADG